MTVAEKTSGLEQQSHEVQLQTTRLLTSSVPSIVTGNSPTEAVWNTRKNIFRPDSRETRKGGFNLRADI